MSRPLPFFFFLLVAACAGRPVVAIKPGADFSKIDRVAVLGFDDYPRQRGSGDLATSVFEKQLLQGGFSIVERRRVEKILEEQKLSVSGAVDPRLAKKLGRILGVDALIMGSVTEFQKPLHEHYTTPVEDERREPIIRRVAKRKKIEEQWVDYEEDEVVGYNTTRTTREEPHTRTQAATVGVAARLVDVMSGEVLWVGSANDSAFTTDEAAEDAAQRILEAVRATWPINRGKK